MPNAFRPACEEFRATVAGAELVRAQLAPVSLVDARLGVEMDEWSVTAWSKNLTNKKYNAEFSPGGFLFKALPRRYGVDLNYRF